MTRDVERTSPPSNLAGHTAPITSVEWAPDGSALATGSYDGLAIIWDEELSPRFKLRHSRLVNGIRWSRTSAQLATSCADGHSYVWNAHSGHLDEVFSRHTDDVNAIAWSPSNTYLATVSEDGTGRLWLTGENELLEAVLVHSDHCMSVDWHPDDSRLATCGEDATIRTWDISGRALSTWPQPTDMEMVRWSPDGKLLGVACDDGTVGIISEAGTLIKRLGPVGGAVKSVAWNGESNRIASGSYDGYLTIWNVQTGEQVSSYRTPRLWPRSVHWSTRSNLIAISSFDGIPVVVEPKEGEEAGINPLFQTRLPTQGVNSISAVGGGFACGLDDGTVRVWEPAKGELLARYVANPGASSLVNAVDARSAGDVLAFGCFSGQIGIIALSGEMLAEATVASPINSVAWHMKGHRLAVADYTGSVSIFDWKDNELSLVSKHQPHTSPVKCIRWLTDGRLVSGSTDRTVRIFTEAGRVELILKGHGNLINSVAVTNQADRLLVASASRDRTVRVWDPATGSCERIFIGHTESVKCVVWKPGSSTELASGSYDCDVRVWNMRADPATSDPSVVIGYHSQGVATLNWADSGLASASWDSRVALWAISQENGIRLSAAASFGELDA